MDWFQTKIAKNLISQEKKIVNKFLEDKFGYFALQLGSPYTNFLESSRINKHLFNQGELKNIALDRSYFPLANDSIDLIILASRGQLDLNAVTQTAKGWIPKCIAFFTKNKK